jgi:hypothetical protein
MHELHLELIEEHLEVDGLVVHRVPTVIDLLPECSCWRK